MGAVRPGELYRQIQDLTKQLERMALTKAPARVLSITAARLACTQIGHRRSLLPVGGCLILAGSKLCNETGCALALAAVTGPSEPRNPSSPPSGPSLHRAPGTGSQPSIVVGSGAFTSAFLGGP
jgi:hypothetical protein